MRLEEARQAASQAQARCQQLEEQVLRVQGESREEAAGESAVGP